ncbi:MAG: hypothetical protein WEB58_22950 [Planctomycetaceae bacterium]
MSKITAKPAKESPWPKSLPEQVQAVRQQLLTSPQPVTADELAKQFCEVIRIESIRCCNRWRSRGPRGRWMGSGM